MDDAKRKLAEGWGLNAESPTTQEILESLEVSVSDFVAKRRKGRVRQQLPSEAMELTLREALDGGNTKVRKFLLDKRWQK